MKNQILSFALYFLMGCPFVLGQVIDLDKEPEVLSSGTFSKSTMYYLTPFSSFSYNIGYSNMHQKLNTELDLNQRKFGENISTGMGWRKKQMFYNFTIAVPPFSSIVGIQNGNARTIAETKDVYFDFTVGHAIVSNDRYFLILRAGAGIQARSIQLTQIYGGTFDLNDLSNPPGNAWPRLDHISGTWDVAVEILPRAFRTLSVLQSLQMGYKGGIGSPVWRSSDMNIENSLSDRVSILYLRFSVVISRER